MATHVALLRGINVGGRNKVAMADLRAVVAGLGHADVSTYIQSGNVLFSAVPGDAANPAALAAALTEAISAALGVSAPVVVLSRDELAEVIAANPFPLPSAADPKRVHAVLLSGPPSAALAGKLDAAVARSVAKGARDELATAGRTLYLHTPDGFGNSDLSAAVLRIVSAPPAGVTGTARNWATVNKLFELAS